MRKAEINAEFTKIMQKWRSKGGRNSVKTRFGGKTKAERAEVMREVSKARWDKVRATRKGVRNTRKGVSATRKGAAA